MAGNFTEMDDYFRKFSEKKGASNAQKKVTIIIKGHSQVSLAKPTLNMVLYENITLGQHVDVLLSNTIYTGTVKYKGSLATQPGDWIGLRMDEPVGNHNGLHKGRQYFHCPDGHGLFVRSNRIRFRSTFRSLYSSYRSVRSESPIDTTLFSSPEVIERDMPKDPLCISSRYDELARQSFPENFAKIGVTEQHHKSHMISRTKLPVTKPMLRERSNISPKLSAKKSKTEPKFSVININYDLQNAEFRKKEKPYPNCICGKHNRYNGRMKCDCTTCKVKCQFPDKIDENRLSVSDTYDLYGYDFVTSPSIPKTHMPYSCQEQQVKLGWDGYHYTREMSAPCGRDSMKFAQWNDISA